jgi:hypothetical protein
MSEGPLTKEDVWLIMALFVLFVMFVWSILP